MGIQRIVLTFLLVFLCSCALVQAQDILYVSHDGTGDGSSWGQASSLADAVDNASAGDEVRLRQGTYIVSTTITFDKRLEILGGFSGSGDQRDPSLYPSIIDGQGSINMIRTGYSSSNTLFDGISFINGYANMGADVNDIKGGALYISGNGTRINNCIFRDNTSENRIGSGAIYLWSANDVLIENSLFENNRAIQNAGSSGNMGGGAIHVRFGSNTRIINTAFRNNYSFYAGGAVDDWGVNTVFENCVFEGNESEEDGGAVYINGNNTMFENCVFEGNESQGNGGAVYVRNDYAHITNCNFIGNRGTDGGGVASSFGGVEISASYFEDNQAQERGGAVYNHRFAEPSTIERSRFSENTADLGGAIYNFSEEGLKIISSLFLANQATGDGGAIFNNQSIEITNTTLVANINTALVHSWSQTTQTTIYNSIFYLNTAKSSSYLADIAPSEGGTDASDKDVRSNIVQEFSEGSNNQIVNPLFVNNANDFRLQINSPAVNTGDNGLFNGISPANAGTSRDVVNEPRLYGSAIDKGAYELQDEPIETVPNCTSITAPLDEANEVALDAYITWDAVDGADGYLVYIGTSTGGTEVIGGEEVTGTSYSLTGGFEENTTYYVTVVPFNSAGEADSCAEISFTTETIFEVPECTAITAPVDGATDVSLDAVITWESMDGAEGYRIYIGTSAGSTDIVNGEEVTGTSYGLPGEFEENTAYYVTVVPFNEAGEAEGCTEVSFTTTTLLVAPECTTITSPADGATDVGLGAGITWTAADGADGYRIFIGTSAGGVDVVDGEEVTGTSFDLPGEFEENTAYYVTVVPFNEAGEAEGCTEVSFTTTTLLVAPECTTITSPADGATDVGLGAGITWTAAGGADGYRIFIGTSAGGVDVVDGEEVTGTSFSLMDGFEENTTYYVRVVPFNAVGEADGCGEISFTTETLLVVPECTVITAPVDGASDVSLDAGITWTTVDNADSYHVYIGTVSGGTDVADGEEVTGTTYTPIAGFEENTTYYVTVIPFNAAGEAEGCDEISFTTETVLEVPECTTITTPVDGATDVALDVEIMWTVVDGIIGYRVFIGTEPGESDMVDGEEVIGTSYSPATGFEENTTYYVRIVSFNIEGEASGCAEIRFTTGEEELPPPIVPECTTITGPADGAEDVDLDAAITWESVDDADGYRIYIGTTSGGTNVVDGEEVTGTSFSLMDGWEENTTYYITVIPFNSAGETEGCGEISFTTEEEELPPPAVPGCTVITSPADGTSRTSLDAGITWLAVDGADGYRISIGTTPDGVEVVDNVEVAGTNFNPQFDFAENITYYIAVIPFNSAGDASGCAQISFVIIPDQSINRTKYGFSPNGDGINDFWQIDGIENYPDNTVSVYNRWGDMVFQIQHYDNLSKVFNGVANRMTNLGAGMLPSGTYFFTIQYRDNQEMKKVNGFLVLRR